MNRLDDLLGVFERSLEIGIGPHCGDDNLFILRECLDMIRSSFMIRDLSTKEIKLVSQEIKKFEGREYFGYYAGIYLSALKIFCDENPIHYDITKITEPIHFLGYRNAEKDIIICGSCGNGVAEQMMSGSVTVYGNVGNNAGGRMGQGWWKFYGAESGTLTVYGHCGNFVGAGGWRGKIIINGNAGEKIGLSALKDVEIHLNGDYKGIDKSCKGCIYHKGRLIWKDGKKTE